MEKHRPPEREVLKGMQDPKLEATKQSFADVFGEELPVMRPIEPTPVKSLLAADQLRILEIREYLDRKAKEAVHGK